MTRILSLLMLSLSTVGCAHLVRGEPPRVEDVVLASRREQSLSPDFDISVRQTGTQLDVTALHPCLDSTIESVERTSTWGLRLGSPTPTILLGVGGAAGIGAGILAMAAPEILFDPATATPTDLTTARIVGGGLAALGLTLLTIAVVDGARATGSETEVARFERPVHIGPARRCETTPGAGGLTFELVAGRQRVELGPTGVDGTFSTDLVGVVPPAMLRAATAALRYGSEDRATIDLQPVRSGVDDEAWGRAQPGVCLQSLSSADCTALLTYLREHPDGAHAAEAQVAVQQLREQVGLRREAERQRLIEEQMQMQAQRAEEERQLRAQFEAEERERRARQQAEGAAAEQARAVRRQCEQTCRRGCGGEPDCVRSCVQNTCH